MRQSVTECKQNHLTFVYRVYGYFGKIVFLILSNINNRNSKGGFSISVKVDEMAGHEDNRTSDDETSSKKSMEVVDENGGIVAEEYDMLDSKLDELNMALDFLEQKNDDIHQKLKELLQSNRQIRQELVNDNTGSSPNNM